MSWGHPRECSVMAAAPPPDGGATDITHTLQSRQLLPCDMQRRGRSCNADGWEDGRSFIHLFFHSLIKMFIQPCSLPQPSPAQPWVSYRI